jgi:hypothetical protein
MGTSMRSQSVTLLPPHLMIPPPLRAERLRAEGYDAGYSAATAEI